MEAIILRRRKLGRTSCREIVANMNEQAVVVRNDKLVPAADVVFRWGTTSNVPHKEGQRVINSAKSIHWCADKKASRLELQAKGVLVPQTWSSWNEACRYGYAGKYVLRPARHAQGRHLLAVGEGLPNGPREAIEFAHFHGEHYVSRLIDKVAEYRVFVCQGRVVWVAKKTPGNPGDVAWNVAQGGRFDNVRWGEWPMLTCRAAIMAALVSGTDFCGVDVMVDADGNPYVLEVNSAPSQTSPYRQSCVAKAFDYIVRNGKEIIECAKFKTWRDVAHPAILPAD